MNHESVGTPPSGNNLDAAVGDVRDQAVARQGPRTELNLRKAPTDTPLASTPVKRQIVHCLPHHWILVLRWNLRMNRLNMLTTVVRN